MIKYSELSEADKKEFKKRLQMDEDVDKVHDGLYAYTDRMGNDFYKAFQRIKERLKLAEEVVDQILELDWYIGLELVETNQDILDKAQDLAQTWQKL